MKPIKISVDGKVHRLLEFTGQIETYPQDGCALLGGILRAVWVLTLAVLCSFAFGFALVGNGLWLWAVILGVPFETGFNLVMREMLNAHVVALGMFMVGVLITFVVSLFSVVIGGLFILPSFVAKATHGSRLETGVVLFRSWLDKYCVKVEWTCEKT